MENTTKSIEALNLSKYYGSAPAIRNLSFSIDHGEVVGFLGPNGAGKSTTMRILTGLLPATSGEAWVRGVSVARHPERIKRMIGYMPENNPLPEDMRVQEYLRFRARLKEIPWRRQRARVAEVLELCDLHRRVRRKLIGTLSKGYRQRVGIADAILSEPEVTIMDEPTIGLDPHQILLIRELINGLRGKTTVILSSHILAEVEMSCDRVLIINQGTLVAAGTPAQLRREFIRGSRYELEAAGAETAVTAALQAVDPLMRLRPMPAIGGARPEGFQRWLATTDNEDDDSEALAARLFATPGIRLRAFGRVEPRLEDIFLAATRRNWEVETQTIGSAPAGPATAPPAEPPAPTPGQPAVS